MRKLFISSVLFAMLATLSACAVSSPDIDDPVPAASVAPPQEFKPPQDMDKLRQELELVEKPWKKKQLERKPSAGGGASAPKTPSAPTEADH